MRLDMERLACYYKSMKHRIVKTEVGYVSQEEYKAADGLRRFKTLGTHSSFDVADFVVKEAYLKWLNRVPRTVATYTDGVRNEP